MATEAWHSLTENIKPKAVFQLCLIQTERKLAFGLLGGYFGALCPSWSHLGLIWGLSWAILSRLGAMLGPCWATSALSGRLLGPFAAISEPRSKERATKVLWITEAGTHAPKSGRPKCCKLQRRASAGKYD